MSNGNTSLFQQTFANLSLISQNLGFHNLASFVVSIIAVILFAAFIATGIIFLRQKSKERKEQIKKVVQEVQKDFLFSALDKTKNGFIKKLTTIFSKSEPIDAATLEELESILFTADIGVKTANSLLDSIKHHAQKQSMTGLQLKELLKQDMKAILLRPSKKLINLENKPHVIMFIGVNGAGKTTSIGKMGKKFADIGKKVIFGAGDTFRAAAVEQLSIWAQRVNALIVKENEGHDSAAVLFSAISKAKEENADVVLCDTAGRLHTKVGLMDELKKVTRVIAKAAIDAPHEVYLVIDATMGQNAIVQAREFALCAPITGVILTKLDGTAKGGVALGIVDELNVPISYIGVGEKAEDLKEFDANKFVEELFA